MRRLWHRTVASFWAHPKAWILGLAAASILACALLVAFRREELPVYTVDETDDYVVVLDLGHGGRDPGAVVRNVPTAGGHQATIYEHAMVFDVGARLMRLLSAHDNIAVLPTVTDGAGKVLISEMKIRGAPKKLRGL